MQRIFVLIAVLVALPCFGFAAEELVVDGYEDAFDTLRETTQPGYRGDSVESAISHFFECGEVDKGTYPASDMWKRNMDLRRTLPPRLSISGRMFFKYSDDDIAPLEKWEHEYEFNMKYTDWSAYFRFSDVNPYAYQADPFRWEKGRIRYRGDGYKVTIGSLSQLFGRGLSLNMYEARLLDFDNEIEGVKVEADVGNSEVTVLHGQRKLRTEPHHATVSAARMEFPLVDGFDIGVHATQVEFPASHYTAETPDMLDYQLIGGDVSLRAGDTSLFAETVQLDRDANELAMSPWDSSGDDGKGYYVSGNASGNGVSLSAEYKNYQGLAHPFNVLPPVRRWSEAASANPDNDEGYGVALDWSPFNDGSMINMSYVQDRQGATPEQYTEASMIYSSPATKNTSWVGEYWYAYEAEKKHDIKRLTINHGLSDDWTASTFIEQEQIDWGFMDPYYDYIYEAELSFQSKMNVVYTYETTGELDVPKDSWGIWELKLRPDDMQEINLIIGDRREGLVCSGGLCRMEPAFDGVRVDYLRRF